jgi:hypothetical protein
MSGPLDALVSLAVIVEVRALFETAVAAIVGGVGVTLAFSVAIYGAARYIDLREAGRTGGAVAAAALGIAGLIVSVAAVGAGLWVMVYG